MVLKPVVKWVGGKRQLVYRLTALLPGHIQAYCEPFVGGGALLFALRPRIASINDINEELMNLYEVIRDDVESLIETLGEFKNDPDCFYSVREWDRDKGRYLSYSKVQRAARVIYLNKTCYNGLFRVNRAGEFNVPFGNHKNPDIVNAPLLRAMCRYLVEANISLNCTDYAEVLKSISRDTFVYLDPPYDPLSETAKFTCYVKGGFDRQEQIRLRQCCDELSERGIKFMLSNSATDFIKEQYSYYNITTFQAKRVVNSDPAKRGNVDELVIRNYK